MAKSRLKLSLKREPALTVSRVAIGKDRLVYILLADKRLIYRHGKSNIAYIGTTKKGLGRIAQSVADRADEILDLYGVKSVTARVVTCKPRSKVKTWVKPENAMLLLFREKYGEIPWCNTQGEKRREGDEFRYFAREAVRRVITRLG